jgi:hypothetical protein
MLNGWDLSSGRFSHMAQLEGDSFLKRDPRYHYPGGLVANPLKGKKVKDE